MSLDEIMLFQFTDFLNNLVYLNRFDICIAGAGVAGTTVAIELSRAGKRVLLLEGGDVDFTEESQDLYKGNIVGREYYDLDVARLRFLGGSSNHWAGFCRPLDEIDFETRQDIESSGWPISKADLSPWLEQAANILETASEFAEDSVISQSDKNLTRIAMHFSPPVRFRDKYIEELKRNGNIWTVLNANVVDIEIDTASGSVRNLKVAGHDDPSQRIDVVADIYVLALGGIENARTLLNANSQITQGVGNSSDLVGRYFSDHPHVSAGYAILRAPIAQLFDDIVIDGRVGKAVSFAVTPRFMRAAGILGCELRLTEISDVEDPSYSEILKARIKRMICDSSLAMSLASYIDKDIKQTRCRLAHQGRSVVADQFNAIIRINSEQAPNPRSRVFLSEERDRFGLRRAALDWRLLDRDKATIRESILELGRYMAGADIGRIRVDDWVIDSNQEVSGMADGEKGAGYHHMGTTRMGASTKNGVVDPQCRVFGMNNLYIAGSSVFPTSGHAAPTFTIVQLALRLTDHLRRRLS